MSWPWATQLSWRVVLEEVDEEDGGVPVGAVDASAAPVAVDLILPAYAWVSLRPLNEQNNFLTSELEGQVPLARRAVPPLTLALLLVALALSPTRPALIGARAIAVAAAATISGGGTTRICMSLSGSIPCSAT